MVSEKFKRGPQQVMMKLLQGIHHGKALTLDCSVIIFGVKQLMSSEINWMINISFTFLHTNFPQCNGRHIYMNMEDLGPIEKDQNRRSDQFFLQRVQGLLAFLCPYVLGVFAQ
jgi:hypothetical protein